MASVAISGKSGSISGLTGGGTEIKSWTLNIKVAALDATSMSSNGWEEFIVGLKGASGTFTCIGVKPDPMDQVAPAALSLITKDTGGTTYAGNAILTNVEVGTPVDNVITYVVSFQFSGEVSIS